MRAKTVLSPFCVPPFASAGIFLIALAFCLPSVSPAAEHDQEEWLIVPKDYTPEKSWPFLLASQNQIAVKAMENVPYFAAYGPSEAVVAPLLETARKYNIDPYRIYATGFSRSGHGLLETAWLYPDRFAAIVPVCEDMRWKEQYKVQKIDLLKYIQQTPTLLLHGDHDSFLTTGKKNYELMKAAGCPVQFGTYPGGHGPDPIYFHDVARLTGFCDRHVLDPYPKVVDHVVCSYAATRAFWVDCQVAKGSVERDYPVFKIRVNDGNRIEVAANEGVRKMAFFLNDKLVDMTRPVSVTFQGKDIYEGRAQPPITVTLREGEVAPSAGQVPLWEQLEAIRSQPSESGAMDWLYLNVQTAFRDTRLGKNVPRRVSIDLGFRAVDGPAAAKILPATKKFADLDAMLPDAALKLDFSGMSRKLSVEATAAVQKFGLSGSVDRPPGDGPVKLIAAGEGKTGEVVLLKLCLANKGNKDLAGVMRLYRNPFLTCPIGVWPKEGPLADSVQGIYEVAGTRGVTWQYFNKHGNEAYQVLGLLMLSAPELPRPTPLLVGKGREFYGVERTLELKAGATLSLPVLMISVPSSDAKAENPRIPDLSGMLQCIIPVITRAED
jgi:dienelactone hydrolase